MSASPAEAAQMAGMSGAWEAAAIGIYLYLLQVAVESTKRECLCIIDGAIEITVQNSGSLHVGNADGVKGFYHFLSALKELEALKSWVAP